MSEGQPGQALGPQGVSNSRHVPCLGPQRVTWMDLGPLAGSRTVDVGGICHLPSSTASAERSFCGLKRLKTYLRSSMLEDRLSALALLHIHQDISVPVDEIIDRFARLGPHRLAYL